ncbi:MAG: hypothetical protein WCG29_07370 [Desulfomonile sp.]|nr:hypothetical protein [Deltaproteobacteria bacterium]
MLRLSLITSLNGALLLVGFCCSLCVAADYEARFVRNYPPGYYGMYYYAQRFSDTPLATGQKKDMYKWDKFMSRVTEIEFPFYPIPYEWDYGTGRTFNLPDYNTNNWP